MSPPATAGTARTKYQDFFALWKDAYPDIPILKQAKKEVREAAVSPYIDIPDRTP